MSTPPTPSTRAPPPAPAEPSRFVAGFSAFSQPHIALTAGIGFAAASGDDQSLTGDTHDRAVAAALEHSGAGKVTETEIGDDGAAYEVEVQLPDGSQVEVQLDQNFAVLASHPDDDDNDDSGSDDTD